MTERDRPRIASVLAADADLELAPRTTAAFDADARLDEVELGLGCNEWHHDLGHHRLSRAFRGRGRRLENGARLHLRYLGISDRQTAAAKPEHRVELLQLAGAIGKLVGIGSHG